MALTKPKLSTNINTDSSVFTDPILVLHQGSSVADVDVGFLMNRSNGLTANAAVIWQESSRSFVHILTNSSGAPDANLNVQSYANVSVGNVLLINNAGIYVDGTLGTAGQVLASDGSKTYWAPPGGFTGGTVSGATVFQSNLVVSNTTTSTSNVTGALVVRGGAGIAGNVYADALRTTTGIYWAGNGNPIAGITYTASASSPAGPSKGDQWYDTVNDILYEYIFDGTSSYWVDIQTSVIAANASTTITDSINANIGAFYTYANTKIGTNTNSNLVVDATTSSTNKTTGALVVKGGAGIAGDVYIGPSLTVDNGAYGNVTTTQFGSLFAYAYGPNNYSIIQAWSQGTQGMGMNAYGTQLYSSGAITFRTGATVKDKDFPTGGVLTVQVAANGAIINGTGIASTSTATGAVIVTGGVGVAGNITVSGNLVANGYSNVFIATGTLLNTSALTIAGNINGRGGVGYLDALTLTSTYSAATNPNKWIRVNSTGGLEIVNSAYTSTIMSLSDGGNLNITGTYQVNGSQAVNGPAFSTVMLTGQTIGASSWSNVIYNGEYYDTHNCYNTTTGVFTPNVAGYYQFNYTAGANSYPSSSGICTVALYKNNFELSRGFRGICNTGGAVVTGTTSCYLNGTTDYVQVKFLQGSSGSVVLESDAGAVAAGGSYANYFNGVMVRGA